MWYGGKALPNSSMEEFDEDCSEPLQDLTNSSPRPPEDRTFTYADTDIDELSTCLGIRCVTDPSVTLARKVGPGLQDLQTRTRRILAEKNTEKAEENTWIGQMVVTESIGELDGLIKSRAA